jgi:DNA (cytosine-5)-methyltransferase 1
MKILNLYAGIGGNRRRWDGHEVTAVEYDPAIAEVYKALYPNDTVVVGDAVWLFRIQLRGL